jgi:hypothetical protein
VDISQIVWNESDASNNTAAPDGAPEGMAPSGVNDVIRADRGAIKRWYNWSIPKVTGGSSTAFTLTYGVAPTALADGMTHLVQFNQACGASPTLNVNLLGAIPIHKYSAGSWGVLSANNVTTDMVALVTYNLAAGAYRILYSSGGFGSPITNVMPSSLTVGGSFVDGPSIAQGSVGIWLATGTVTVGGNSAGNYNAKLYDGTTVIASTSIYIPAAGVFGSMALSGIATSPAGNLRIAVNTDAISASIISSTGAGNASTISAIRVG